MKAVKELKINPEITPDWYLINGEWHHCVTINNKRYVDGCEQK